MSSSPDGVQEGWDQHFTSNSKQSKCAPPVHAGCPREIVLGLVAAAYDQSLPRDLPPSMWERKKLLASFGELLPSEIRGCKPIKYVFSEEV